MEVILKKDVENLGYANDIVSVKPGYANNYLLPRGLATVATESAKKVLAENLKQRAHKDAKILADAQALAAKIEGLALVITAKAEEGRIFGSVTSADLAEAMAAQSVEVDRKNISVEPVKQVGQYEATVKLHRDVKATLHFSVVAAQEEKQLDNTRKMKKDIHPKNYRLVAFKDMSNDHVFITRSAVNTKETIAIDGETYPVYKMEISNTSHPFYTGKMKLVDTAGRVDKFMSRYQKHYDKKNNKQ